MPPNELLRRPAFTVIDDFVRAWHVSMPVPIQRTAFANLTRVFTAKQQFSFGTACSGSDLVQRWVDALMKLWSEHYEKELQYSWEFVCEIDVVKQKFLADQHRFVRLFTDVGHLAQTRAYDAKSSGASPVPYVDVFMAGFSCTSRSKLNRSRSSNIHCVQNSSGATGHTFDSTFAYVRKYRPSAVLLENVVDLLEESDSHMSDAAYIKDQLVSIEYETTYEIIEASEHGSPAVRKRIYFFALDSHSGSLKVTGRLSFLPAVLAACKVEPLQPKTMIVRGEDELTQLDAHFAFDPDTMPDRDAESARKDAIYKDDHMDLYRAKNLTWPPDISGKEFRGLSRRAAEVCFFAHHAWPLLTEQDQPEFLDVNNSLPRLMGKKELGEMPSPWRLRLNTVTGQTLCVVRYWVNKEIMLRLLRPYEILGMAGWDFSCWRPGTASVDYPLAASLAGNAFSGFAVGVALVGLFVCMGAKGAVQQPPKPSPEDCDESLSSPASDEGD